MPVELAIPSDPFAINKAVIMAVQKPAHTPRPEQGGENILGGFSAKAFRIGSSSAESDVISIWRN